MSWGIPAIAYFIKPGTVEIHADYNRDKEELHEVNLTYNFLKGMNYGLYGTFGLGNPKPSWDKIKAESYSVVSGGVTLFSWDIQSVPVLSYIRLVPILGSAVGHTHIASRLGLRGEIHGPRPLNIHPVSFQISLFFIRDIVGPKHPLTY